MQESMPRTVPRRRQSKSHRSHRSCEQMTHFPATTGNRLPRNCTGFAAACQLIPLPWCASAIRRGRNQHQVIRVQRKNRQRGLDTQDGCRNDLAAFWRLFYTSGGFSPGPLDHTRWPITRLTASRRRQRPQQLADACGLPLNVKHLIRSRVE